MILNGNEDLTLALLLLGCSPCTAMVLVWGRLAGSNQEQNLITTSLNTVTIIFLYPPVIKLYAGLGSVEIEWVGLLISAVVFIGAPLILGITTKLIINKYKTQEWFDS
jgi:ACR3 family arsenite transporter